MATTTPVRRAAPAAPAGGGRALTWAGGVLVLIGLGLVGYLVWELYGTTWVAHRHQQQIVQSLRREWAEPESRSAPPGETSGTVRTPAGTAGAIVRIPRFGAHYAVPVIQGTDEDALASGIGHFTGTAGPGRVGNFALAAHRITHGEPFSRMPELRVGDRVLVETRKATYTYRVDNAGDSLDLSFTNTWVLAPHPVDPTGGIGPVAGSDRLITLTTCAELFHTDQRLIVFGHLVATTPRD